MEIEHLIRYASRAVGLMKIEKYIRSPARAVGLKPQAMRGEVRLCGLYLPLIPPTPFSHKGRRGSRGVLMPEMGEGTPLPSG